MKAEKLIGLYLAPHFLAISLLLAFIAARWGFASSSARLYEIAPVCSHNLMVFISSVCFIISSFMFLVSYALDFKGRSLLVQGFSRFFLVFLWIFCGFSSILAFFVFPCKVIFPAISARCIFPAYSGIRNGIENALKNRLQTE